METHHTIRFATRPSALARWQTNFIMEALQAAWEGVTCQEIIITTKGDQILDKPLPEIGGKGLFTYELEQALYEKTVDAAVHSLKDLPTDDAPGLFAGIIPQRVDPRDALVCPAGHSLVELPEGAVVGTSSIRRQAQLLALRPDLQVRSIRGNVDTRLRKVQAGQYDAIILAAAGVTRLGLQSHITEYLGFETMLPAPGQGALGVQCRADDDVTRTLLQKLTHQPTRQAVLAERAFLAALGSGCSLPVGAYATLDGEMITLDGVVASLDGRQVLRVAAVGSDPLVLGDQLAQQAFAQGAGDLLAALPGSSQPKTV